MLKLCRIAILVVGSVGFGASGIAVVTAQAPANTRDILHTLAGKWKAPEYKVPASTDLDVSVWGRGASKVRNVELALEPDGDGILRVHTAVVDQRGRTKRFSASVVEAHLRVQPPSDPAKLPIEPRVTVVSAEERYLDDSGDRRPIEGLTVKLHAMSPTSREMNFRFDTAEGRGSFGETLVRQSGTSRRGTSGG